jgi:hypothetical protein
MHHASSPWTPRVRLPAACLSLARLGRATERPPELLPSPLQSISAPSRAQARASELAAMATGPSSRATVVPPPSMSSHPPEACSSTAGPYCLLCAASSAAQPPAACCHRSTGHRRRPPPWPASRGSPQAKLSGPLGARRPGHRHGRRSPPAPPCYRPSQSRPHSSARPFGR